MILNPKWQKPKEKPYFHQISMDCLGKLVECQGKFNKGKKGSSPFLTTYNLLVKMRKCHNHYE